MRGEEQFWENGDSLVNVGGDFICDKCGVSEPPNGGMWEPFNDGKHVCEDCISKVFTEYLTWSPAPHLCQTLVQLDGGRKFMIHAKECKLKSKPYRYVSKKDRNIILHQDAICENCGTDKKLTIDHIKPVSKGGLNRLNNYQALCKSCNSSKGNRIV